MFIQRMNEVIRTLLLVLVVSLESLCRGQVISDHIIHQKRPQEVRPRAGAPIKVANSTNEFALDLYHALPYTGNSIFSPLALSTVLSMVYLGAKDDTKQQMNRVLGFESAGLRGEEPHYGFQQIQKYLARKDSKNEFNYVKGLFLQKGFDILQEYRNKLKSFYGVAAESVDFANSSKAVTEAVNKWVADATRNKIPNFLEEPLDSTTKLFLMSAVYFKGYWQTKFEKSLTEQDYFYNNGKDPVLVPIMRMRSKFPFAYDREVGLMAVELPYRGNETSMLLLLPENRTGLPLIEQSIDAVMLENIVSKLEKASVQVELPRFSIQADYALPDVLKSIGMTSLFDPSKADLSGITGNKTLYVSEVIHKSVIEVNEEGSEAVAVGGIGAVIRVGLANTAYFLADHPFMFIIRDIRSGLIYFIGRVTEL